MKKIIKKEEIKKSKRPSWDEYFTSMVELVGTRSTCDRGKSGCVIVKDKRVLSTGYIGSPMGTKHCDEAGHEMHTVIQENGKESRHCIRTAHAEQNAIVNAARFGIALDGATLYCHMTPCYVCAKMIINCGIVRVVCEKHYHAAAETIAMFKKAQVKLEVLTNETQTYEDM